MPHINLWEACYFANVPDGPQSYTPLAPIRRSPDTHVWVKPKLHTHKGCGLRFLPVLHTSYTVDCPAALVGEDVSSGCYVQWESQLTVLDWVLLKDRNLALASRQGSEISSWACLWVSPRPRHHTQCWLTNQQLILLCISWLETCRASWGPRNPWTEPHLVNSLAISLPRIPACPGTQYSPTDSQSRYSRISLVCSMTISFVMSVCPSMQTDACMEQPGSHWTDFHESWVFF